MSSMYFILPVWFYSYRVGQQSREGSRCLSRGDVQVTCRSCQWFGQPETWIDEWVSYYCRFGQQGRLALISGWVGVGRKPLPTHHYWVEFCCFFGFHCGISLRHVLLSCVFAAQRNRVVHLWFSWLCISLIHLSWKWNCLPCSNVRADSKTMTVH